MDTPDKAAGLADSQIADAVNKEWLLSSCSARSVASQQLSSNSYPLGYQQLSLSINASDKFYGSVPSGNHHHHQRHHQHITEIRDTTHKSDSRLVDDETTSLILNNNNNRNSNQKTNRRDHHYHLYDNIGFKGSPLIAGSISSRKTASVYRDYHDDDDDSQDDHITCAERPNNIATSNEKGFFKGKFRIFLAFYVLIGITLAIYSRSALSLASVGMVANNVVDRELVNILAASMVDNDRGNTGNNNINNKTLSITTAIQNNDGSCLISDRHLNNRHQQDASSRKAVSNVMSHLPAGVNFNQAHRYQLEQAFRSSIKHRIELGLLVDWSPSEQGLIFAAGSVGNLLISIPITRMGEIYGPKWVIFIALTGATIQAALMPIVAPSHISLVILFQIIFSGLAYGADCVAYTLFAYWLTPTEIAFFVACLVVCYQLGAILSSVITAQILTRALNWSWCFHVPAILCGLWTFVWIFIGASEPATSRIISKEELDYLIIKSKLSQAATSQQETASSMRSTPLSCSAVIDNNDDDDNQGRQQHQHQHKQRRPVSWLKLARDPNIWAIIAVKFTLRWYFSVNLSLMPTYLSSVAHMSVDTIGKFSAMQSIIGLVSGVFMGYITKSVVSKRPFNLSLPAFRKIFQSVVNFGLAGSLAIFIVFDCDKWATISALTLACVCINFHVAAALQLPLDLSPNYCGLITSITNTLALGQAIGAPISGLILNSAPKDRKLWSIVWGICILLNCLSGFLFILLVDSKPRDYSKSSGSKSSKTEKIIKS